MGIRFTKAAVLVAKVLHNKLHQQTVLPADDAPLPEANAPKDYRPDMQGGDYQIGIITGSKHFRTGINFIRLVGTDLIGKNSSN